MNFLPVVLWSDVLVWLLVAGALALAWGIARNPPLRSAWARVGQSGVGMGAAVLLVVFVLVGLLDSLHYRERLPGDPGAAPVYGVEVLSALDGALSALRENNEKTYSAPLATRSFAMEMETFLGPEGQHLERRQFPRLRFGGAHLGSREGDRGADIGKRLALAGGLALLLWLGSLAGVLGRFPGHAWGVRWQRLWRPEPEDFAWRGVLVAWGGILVVVLPLFCLVPAYHVFGTDKVGQDVLYQVLKSIRTALVIGLVTTLVTLPLAVLLGTMAGYFRGWVDDLIQYLYTTLNSIPGVLLIAAAVLMMQGVLDRHPQWFDTAAERADMRLLALCFILGLTSWTGLARLLRGETLKLARLEYIQAAQAFGVSSLPILLRHILPNLFHLVLISLVMDFSSLVLAEAVLSYVGIGVDPSMISFGTMINNARMELAREPMVWWSLVAAFFFMFALVLAANLFADVVRDAFDPRRRA